MNTQAPAGKSRNTAPLPDCSETVFYTSSLPAHKKSNKDALRRELTASGHA